MPPKTNDPKLAFVAQEGLYLALHPDNPQYNPDSLAVEKMMIISSQDFEGAHQGDKSAECE